MVSTSVGIKEAHGKYEKAPFVGGLFSFLGSNLDVVKGVVQDDPEAYWPPLRSDRVILWISHKGSFDHHPKPTFCKLPHLEEDVIFEGDPVFIDHLNRKVIQMISVMEGLSFRQGPNDLRQSLRKLVSTKVEYSKLRIIKAFQGFVVDFRLIWCASEAMGSKYYVYLINLCGLLILCGPFKPDSAGIKMRQIISLLPMLKGLPLRRHFGWVSPYSFRPLQNRLKVLRSLEFEAT
jgi:hypothetical protein